MFRIGLLTNITLQFTNNNKRGVEFRPPVGYLYYSNSRNGYLVTIYHICLCVFNYYYLYTYICLCHLLSARETESVLGNYDNRVTNDVVSLDSHFDLRLTPLVKIDEKMLIKKLVQPMLYVIQYHIFIK